MQLLNELADGRFFGTFARRQVHSGDNFQREMFHSPCLNKKLAKGCHAITGSQQGEDR